MTAGRRRCSGGAQDLSPRRARVCTLDATPRARSERTYPPILDSIVRAGLTAPRERLAVVGPNGAGKVDPRVVLDGRGGHHRGA